MENKFVFNVNIAKVIVILKLLIISLIYTIESKLLIFQNKTENFITYYDITVL